MEVYQLGNKVFVYERNLMSFGSPFDSTAARHTVSAFIDNEPVAVGMKTVDTMDDQNEALGYAIEAVLKNLRLKNIFIDDDFIYHELLNHFGTNFTG